MTATRETKPPHDHPACTDECDGTLSGWEVLGDVYGTQRVWREEPCGCHCHVEPEDIGVVTWDET